MITIYNLLCSLFVKNENQEKLKTWSISKTFPTLQLRVFTPLMNIVMI